MADAADAVARGAASGEGHPIDTKGRMIVDHHGAGVEPVCKANRRWKRCYSPFLYRDRNAIERMFGRIEYFRRIATRCDRLATNFPAAICLVATICYWL